MNDVYDDFFETKFLWQVSYSLVNEGIITALRIDKELSPSEGFRKPFTAFKYNVFDEKDIYEKFALINTNDLSNIEEFVNKYGILGLHIEEMEDKYTQYKNSVESALNDNDLDKLKKIVNINKVLELSEKDIFYEETSDFIKEVKLMRNLLTLIKYDNIKASEGEETTVKSIIKEIEDLACIDFDCSFPDKMLINSYYILLQHKAKALISAIISIKMKNVKPKLRLIYDTKNKKYEFISTWEPKTLLGCMYTMLYNDLSQGIKTDICTVCGYPLILRNKGRRWHTDCRGKKNTNKTRERVTNKVKEYIIEKYSNRPNINTVEIYENENDVVTNMFGGTAKDIFNKTKINEWLGRK